MSQSKRNTQGGGIEVILNTPNNGCIKILAPIDWPGSQTEGLRLLRELCLKQEVKKNNRVVGRKITKNNFESLKGDINCVLKSGGDVCWSEGKGLYNKNILVSCTQTDMLDNYTACYLGGNSTKVDRMIERFLCIMGF